MIYRENIQFIIFDFFELNLCNRYGFSKEVVECPGMCNVFGKEKVISIITTDIHCCHYGVTCWLSCLFTPDSYCCHYRVTCQLSCLIKKKTLEVLAFLCCFFLFTRCPSLLSISLEIFIYLTLVLSNGRCCVYVWSLAQRCYLSICSVWLWMK